MTLNFNTPNADHSPLGVHSFPMTTPAENPEPEKKRHRGSRIISSVLSPAIQLWLRTQVEQIQECQIQITGSDRQILTGYVPQVAIAATDALYQGLHLSEVKLTGTNIRVNMGQVIKGKPLRLLEPISVMGELRLLAADFNESLKTPLLVDAVQEFILPKLPLHPWVKDVKSLQVQRATVEIGIGILTLKIVLLDSHNQQIPLTLQTGLQLANPQELCFQQPHLQIFPTLTEITDIPIDSFPIHLGSDVEIATLTLNPDEIICQGTLTINP